MTLEERKARLEQVQAYANNQIHRGLATTFLKFLLEEVGRLEKTIDMMKLLIPSTASERLSTYKKNNADR